MIVLTNLQVIIENIGEDKDYSCNRCNKKYKTSDLLKEHYWFKHQEQFNCPYDTCKLTYTKYGVFYFHLMTVHAGFIETITEFPCIYCDEKFANLPEVERHQRKQNACSGKKIPCTHCSKMFGSERMLNNHMLRMTNQVVYKFLTYLKLHTYIIEIFSPISIKGYLCYMR